MMVLRTPRSSASSEWLTTQVRHACMAAWAFLELVPRSALPTCVFSLTAASTYGSESSMGAASFGDPRRLSAGKASSVHASLGR